MKMENELESEYIYKRRKVASVDSDTPLSLSRLKPEVRENKLLAQWQEQQEKAQPQALRLPKIKDKYASKQKLMRRRVDQYKIELQNPCQQRKKLLVLDIDYTLFDHRSTAENPLQLMRPFLHEFLTAAYAEYDIMIWSATSMKWVELKMGQLGVRSNPNYKITALLDYLAMITVQFDSRGIFDCKPLCLIWAQFPEFYSSKNTIMFDDLRRNFAMNPQNGLIIKPFKKAHSSRDSDHELLKLTTYLLAITELDDLSNLDHNNWQSFSEDNVKGRRSASMIFKGLPIFAPSRDELS